MFPHLARNGVHRTCQPTSSARSSDLWARSRRKLVTICGALRVPHAAWRGPALGARPGPRHLGTLASTVTRPSSCRLMPVSLAVRKSEVSCQSTGPIGMSVPRSRPLTKRALDTFRKEISPVPHRLNGRASPSVWTRKAPAFMRKPRSKDRALGSGLLQPTGHRQRGSSDQQSHLMRLGRDTGPQFLACSQTSPEPAVRGPPAGFVRQQVSRDDMGALDRAD